MNLCLNYEICQQVKYNILHLYCTDCFIYFNKKIDLIKNENNNQCPICLENDNELEIYQFDQCDHSICKNCLYNIYFDKEYINNAPRNPFFELDIKWFNFIKSKRSNKLKYKIINKLNNRYTYSLDDINYELTINDNIYIPKIFKNKIILLIDFQIKIQKYFDDYQRQKNNKIKYIKKCPYCRKNSNELCVFNILN
jgi:hypothetical protein